MRPLWFLIFSFIIPLASMSQDEKQFKAIGVTASLPWVNSYSYKDYQLQNTSSRSGFAGLGASVYYKSGKNKFSLNYGFTGSLPAPIGAVDYGKEGTRTNIVSNFLEGIIHKNVAEKLNIIAGANYVKYRFDFISYVDTMPSYSISDKTLGLTIGAEYRFNRIFAIAIFYRPTIVSLDNKKYRHLISLDARFDINLWKHD